MNHNFIPKEEFKEWVQWNGYSINCPPRLSQEFHRQFRGYTITLVCLNGYLEISET